MYQNARPIFVSQKIIPTTAAKKMDFRQPSFLLYHHIHSVFSLMVRICLGIVKEAHLDVNARVIQIEVKLAEHGEMPT